MWADRAANYVRDVAVPCGFARPWWKVRLRGAVPLGSAKHAGVNAACRCGERDDWRYRVIGLLLVCGQTVWGITSVMSQCHADLRGLGGSTFAWRRATGERETCWRKRGVSLVSGMIRGIV